MTDYIRVGIEHGGYTFRADHYGYHYCNRDDNRHKKRIVRAFPGARDISRAEVLPDERCCGKRNGLNGQKHKLVDFIVGGPSAQRRGLIGIDVAYVRLHEHVGKCGERKLDCRGNTHFYYEKPH